MNDVVLLSEESSYHDMGMMMEGQGARGMEELMASDEDEQPAIGEGMMGYRDGSCGARQNLGKKG